MFPGEPVLKGTFHMRLPHFAMLGDVSETAAPQTPFTPFPQMEMGRTPVFLNGVQLHGGNVCETSHVAPRKG